MPFSPPPKRRGRVEDVAVGMPAIVASRARARDLQRQRQKVLTFRRTFIQTRKRGHAAMRAWAYRFGEAGESRFPDKDGNHEVDYTNRYGIGPRGCVLPEDADESWRDGRTWAQRIEGKDYRSNSRQFRDDVIALPRAVVDAGRAEEVVKAYAARIAKRWGTAVHWVIHDLDGPNPHAHVCYAGRRIEGAEFAAKRDREQDAVTRPAKGKHPATQSITDLHSEYWVATLANEGLEASFEQGEGEDAQAHVGPKAWSVEKRAIRNEIAAELAEIYPEASAEELQAAAYAATSEITVTQALAMDREPVTEAMQDCPKPGGPSIAPDEPLPALAPSIEADEALAPPLPIAAYEQTLSPPLPDIAAALDPPLPIAALEQTLAPPAPLTAAELDAPAPTVTPDRPIEPPVPIAARDEALDPPTPTIAADLHAPIPAVTPDRPIEAPVPVVTRDQALAPPAPAAAAELDAPAPTVTPDRPIEAPVPIVARDEALAAPAPIIAADLHAPIPAVTPDRPIEAPVPVVTRDQALAPPAPATAAELDAPAPQVTWEQGFDRTPAPSVAEDEPLPAPAPAIAAPLPEPEHIREERRLKAAEAFEAEKRKAAERAARDRLAGAVTADRLEAAGEALIRNHAGDASAYAHVPGVGRRTDRAAIKQMRAHAKGFHVPDRHRRIHGRSFTGKDYQRHNAAIAEAIGRWRAWWRGGMVRASAAARIVPAMIRDLWPTHWEETQEEQRAAQQRLAEQAARTRRQREQGRARPRIVEAPAPRRGRGRFGWNDNGPGGGIGL